MRGTALRNAGFRAAATLALALLVCGCAAPRYYKGPLNAYTAQAATLPAIRTIAIFPFDRGPASPQSARLVEDTLATQLARRYRVVRYHPPAPGTVQQPPAGLVEDLLAARDTLRADAALLGAIVDYRPYEPPSITMSLKLLSTTDGSVIWAASGTIDAARPDIEQRVRKYYTHARRPTASLFGWRSILLAERQYANYVANEFLLTFNIQGRQGR